MARMNDGAPTPANFAIVAIIICLIGIGCLWYASMDRSRISCRPGVAGTAEPASGLASDVKIAVHFPSQRS